MDAVGTRTDDGLGEWLQFLSSSVVLQRMHGCSVRLPIGTNGESMTARSWTSTCKGRQMYVLFFRTSLLPPSGMGLDGCAPYLSSTFWDPGRLCGLMALKVGCSMIWAMATWTIASCFWDIFACCVHVWCSCSWCLRPSWMSIFVICDVSLFNHGSSSDYTPCFLRSPNTGPPEQRACHWRAKHLVPGSTGMVTSPCFKQ